MGLFSKKEIYQYSILEKYKIDIEKTNKAFLNGESKESWRGREFCELVAQNDKYEFYEYKSYSDHSGGYILRREKSRPKNIVYFGENKLFNCIFHSHLFQVNRHGERGVFYISARNVETGKQFVFESWLSDKAVYKVINKYGRYFCQDSIKDVFVKNDCLIFKVSRKKSYDPHHEDTNPNEYDIDMEYDLVVVFNDNEFIATPLYPVNEMPLSESSHEAVLAKTNGDALLDKKDFPAAIEQYKKAILMYPTYSDAWIKLGYARGMNAEFEESLMAFNTALELDPKSKQARFGKSVTLGSIGQLDEALAIVNDLLVVYNDDYILSYKTHLINVKSR